MQLPVFGDIRTAVLPQPHNDPGITAQPHSDPALSVAPQQPLSGLDPTVSEDAGPAGQEDLLSSAASNGFLTTVKKSWNIGRIYIL